MTETENPQQPGDRETRLLERTLEVLGDQVRVQGALMKAQNAQLETCRQQAERQVDELHQTRQELALRDRLLGDCRQQLQRAGEDLVEARQSLAASERLLSQCRLDLQVLRRRGVMGWLRLLLDRLSGR